MDELKVILKEIKEIKSMLRRNVTKIKKWVYAKELTQFTIWDNAGKLRSARNNGYVEFKIQKGKGIIYNLDSIHNKFLKNNT